MTAEWGSPCLIMRIFEKKIDFGDYFDTHDQENIQILSGISIRIQWRVYQKYTEIFDIPSQEHLLRSYRLHGDTEKDLWDTKEYPEICLQTEIRFICPIWQP